VEVIATHGIDGATTRRIADEAKANLAMLHYCYDSKEDLFADVYKFVAGRFQEVIKESDPQSSVVDSAREVLRGVMEFYLESPNFTATTLELINWARRQHGDRGIAVYDQAMETLRLVLQTAAADQPLDPELIDEIAYVTATLADGFAASWLTYGDRGAALKQIDIATSVLETWLTARLESVPAR
jgi:AcrR family transcriptional regulator